MNQGAPAAMTGSSCSVWPRPKMRSEPRSSALVANVAASRSSEVCSSGLRWRQSASRRAGTERSIGSSLLYRSGASWPSRLGVICTDAVQVPPLGITACQVSSRGVADGSPVPVTDTPPTFAPRLQRSQSVPPWVLASTSSSSFGRPRPSLTSNRSAKSPSTATVRCAAAASRPRLRSVMSSRMPLPTYRWRITSSVLSAWHGPGGRRPRNVQAYGSECWTATASGGSPSSWSSSRLTNRVSRKNRPCAPPGRMSPEGSLMQNEVSSRSVTRPLPGRPSIGGPPLGVQACVMAVCVPTERHREDRGR